MRKCFAGHGSIAHGPIIFYAKGDRLTQKSNTKKEPRAANSPHGVCLYHLTVSIMLDLTGIVTLTVEPFRVTFIVTRLPTLA